MIKVYSQPVTSHYKSTLSIEPDILMGNGEKIRH